MERAQRGVACVDGTVSGASFNLLAKTVDHASWVCIVIMFLGASPRMVPSNHFGLFSDNKSRKIICGAPLPRNISI